jgi:lipopolysaccharide export system protein LptA
MLILLVCWSATGAGQSTQSSDDEWLDLQADVFRYETINGAAVTKLSGNVRLENGDVTLTCRRGTVFSRESRYEFTGDVRIEDDRQVLESQHVVYRETENRFYCERAFTLTRGDTVLQANRGVYDRDLGMATATGNVVYRESSLSAQSDSAAWDDSRRRIDIIGNVTLALPDDDVRIFGQAAFALPDSQQTEVTGKPRLVRRRAGSLPPMIVTGDTLKFWRTPFRLTVIGNARVQQDSLLATGIQVQYQRSDSVDTMALRGNPQIVDRGQILDGEIIDVIMQQDTLRSVRAEGRAEARSLVQPVTDDSLQNILHGTTITMQFVAGDLKEMAAVRNAESLYYSVENGRMTGGNHVLGEAITVEFSQGAFEQVNVDGTGSGTYYPPHLMEQMISEIQGPHE